MGYISQSHGESATVTLLKNQRNMIVGFPMHRARDAGDQIRRGVVGMQAPPTGNGRRIKIQSLPERQGLSDMRRTIPRIYLAFLGREVSSNSFNLLNTDVKPGSYLRGIGGEPFDSIMSGIKMCRLPTLCFITLNGIVERKQQELFDNARGCRASVEHRKTAGLMASCILEKQRGFRARLSRRRIVWPFDLEARSNMSKEGDTSWKTSAYPGDQSLFSH
jgi:hypothetical protein